MKSETGYLSLCLIETEIETQRQRQRQRDRDGNRGREDRGRDMRQKQALSLSPSPVSSVPCRIEEEQTDCDEARDETDPRSHALYDCETTES